LPVGVVAPGPDGAVAFQGAVVIRASADADSKKGRVLEDIQPPNFSPSCYPRRVKVYDIVNSNFKL
jgi:hypothetical protein